jgi:VanZ family protein
MALIFLLSSISHPPTLPEGADKNLHALLYAGLGVLLVRALAGGVHRRVLARSALIAVAIAAAYGVTDEFHQWFVPPRSVEGLDVVADTLGAALAASVLWVRSALAFREPTDRSRGI